MACGVAGRNNPTISGESRTGWKWLGMFSCSDYPALVTIVTSLGLAGWICYWESDSRHARRLGLHAVAKTGEQMGIFQWLDSSVRYGRRLVDSGLVAAQEGGEAFLKEESGEVFLKEAAQKALVPAAIGACIGAIIGCAGPRNSRSKVLLAALAGGAIGYGSGIIWESRHLTRSVSSNVFKEIGKVRDQHWLEQNPIDYA